jgi:hypothetical protein
VVLAYLFWHRPLEGADLEAYEQALLAFHRSLARTPPVGLCGSAAFRVAELPWPPAAPAPPAAPVPGAVAVRDGAGARPGYEDWYVVEDYAALGVLGEAAVGRGHRTPHDEAARHFGAGAGGLYGMIEGERSQIGQGARRPSIGEAGLAVWVSRPPGSKQRALGELLGDGMDPSHASLWRRQLVLGPAPEYCLLASEPPPGVSPTRLPSDWTAVSLERELLWGG